MPCPQRACAPHLFLGRPRLPTRWPTQRRRVRTVGRTRIKVLVRQMGMLVAAVEGAGGARRPRMHPTCLSTRRRQRLQVVRTIKRVGLPLIWRLGFRPKIQSRGRLERVRSVPLALTTRVLLKSVAPETLVPASTARADRTAPVGTVCQRICQ